MPLISLAELKSIVQSDLGDPGLQLLEDAAEQEVLQHCGPHYPGPVTLLRERVDLSLQTRNWLYLDRPISQVGASATLITALTGLNNDLSFGALIPGSGGNSISIEYRVAGLGTPLSVVVSGYNIVVNLATNGSGVAISTASQVLAALLASTAAALLVLPSLASGNDGTGVATVMPPTNLTGGVGGITSIYEYWGDEFNEVQTFLLPSDYRIHYNGMAVERLGNGANARWLFGHRVSITYVPEDDTARRKVVISELVRMATRHSGVKDQTIGDTRDSSYDSYVYQREMLIQSLQSGLSFS